MKKHKHIAHHPLLSWDIISQAPHRQKGFREIHLLEEQIAKHNWSFDIHRILGKPIDAIVITDLQQVIQWVSPGFRKMTGYSASYAIGKRPAFLQGADTESYVRDQIRSSILQSTEIETRITNYRKNQSSYLCHVHIFPLFSQQQVLTNFLAIERALN